MPQVTKAINHRDPNPGNILFEKNKVSGFIDFELSECNVRLLDPCYCATAILSECQDLELGKGKWLVILKGVLEGYNEVCNFTDEEKKAIFYVLCANQMTCTAYFENISEYKELARMNREMLIFIIESKDEILNIFL